jgi:hypothetical protein
MHKLWLTCTPTVRIGSSVTVRGSDWEISVSRTCSSGVVHSRTWCNKACGWNIQQNSRIFSRNFGFLISHIYHYFNTCISHIALWFCTARPVIKHAAILSNFARFYSTKLIFGRESESPIVVGDDSASRTHQQLLQISYPGLPPRRKIRNCLQKYLRTRYYTESVLLRKHTIYFSKYARCTI